MAGHSYLGPVLEPHGAPAFALRTGAGHRQTQPHSPWRLTR